MPRFKEVIDTDNKLWINSGLEPSKFFTKHYAQYFGIKLSG